MSSKASKILWISMIVTMIQSCSQEAGVKQPVKTQAPTIEAISIQEKQLSKQVTLPGELKPWNKVNILARVRGYVGQAYVDRGSFVKKGQVLVTLEAPEIEAELSNAKARYTAAEHQLVIGGVGHRRSPVGATQFHDPGDWFEVVRNRQQITMQSFKALDEELVEDRRRIAGGVHRIVDGEDDRHAGQTFVVSQ